MATTGQRNDIRNLLLDDLRLVIKDVEDLLRTSGQQVNETYRLARAKFKSTLSSTRSGLTTLEDRLSTTARDAFETTHDYVQSNPWQAVGAGALTGLAIGLLIGRR